MSADEGWKDHGGGECPVTEAVLVDVIFRDGDTAIGVPALSRLSTGFYAECWTHEGDHPGDIMKWRLHDGKIAVHVCTTCGSANIKQDAWIHYNDRENIQGFDDLFCENCQSSCKTKEVEVSRSFDVYSDIYKEAE